MREHLHGHFRHFLSNNHSIKDIDVTIITTTVKNPNIRLRTEETYIAKFRTKKPSGLNIIQ